MVSQQVVEDAMTAIGIPCTPREISNYLIDNKISTVKSDVSWDISGVLNILRKWEIADKLPDLHGEDISNKWYLCKNGNPHDPKKCNKCNAIKLAYNSNASMALRRYEARKVRKVSDYDHLAVNDFEITNREW